MGFIASKLSRSVSKAPRVVKPPTAKNSFQIDSKTHQSIVELQQKDENLVANMNKLSNMVQSRTLQSGVYQSKVSPSLPSRPLPKNRSTPVHLDPEPTEGFLNSKELCMLIRLHREDPQQHSVEGLAEKFKVNQTIVASLLKHVSLPKVWKTMSNDMVGTWRHTTGVKFQYFGEIKDQGQKQTSEKAQLKAKETEELRTSVQMVMTGKPDVSPKEVAQTVIEKIKKSKGMK